MDSLQLQFVEQVFVKEGEDTDKISWERKKILPRITFYFNFNFKF